MVVIFEIFKVFYIIMFRNGFPSILGPLGAPFGRPSGVLGGDLGALGATEGHLGTLKRSFFHTTSILLRMVFDSQKWFLGAPRGFQKTQNEPPK